MATFLISDGETIVNAILADTKEIAEEVTGMTAYTAEELPEGCSIGWTWNEVEFVPPVELVVEETPAEEDPVDEDIPTE